MKSKLLVNTNFNLIQQVRLIHALTESNFDIVIPPAEADKFSILKEMFKIDLFTNDSISFDISSYLKISHKEPLTLIGDISRPLIFPTAITNYCRSIWCEKRNYRYSFQGLITIKRKHLIEDWIEKNISHKNISLNTENFIYKLQKKMFSKLGLDYTMKKRIGDLLLWSSDRGRRFPIKAWDEKYFRVLADSQYVLCPSGDYTWSYRFFESILCGAIPIVEKHCSVYDGFRFFFFTDQAEKLKWRLEDAEYNYKLCIEKLTVPKAILNEELTKIITRK